MTQNTNQNEVTKDNGGEEETNAESSPVNSTAQNNSAVPNKKPGEIPKGALKKALVRTLRGDVSKSLGPNASVQQIDNFAPKSTPKKPQVSSDKNLSTPVPKKKNDAIVHTFKDDVQNLVRNKKMSFARIVALESDRSERIPQAQKKRDPWKTTMIISLAVLFLIIGIIMAFGAFYAYRLNTAPNLTPQFDPSIVFTEAREKIDVTNKNSRGIMALLGNSRRSTLLTPGSIVELYITKLVESSNAQKIPYHLNSIDFLEAIEAFVPETFLQTLGPDYIIGVYTIDENIPFLILTTQSYGYAFSGMLEWEKNIEENLMPFFSPNTDLVKPAIAKGGNMFTDTIVENFDVRILRDSNGVIRILYSFIDRNTVIITTDSRTLIELSKRLRIQR